MVEVAISTSKAAFTFVDGKPKMYGGKGADKVHEMVVKTRERIRYSYCYDMMRGQNE